MPRRAQSGMMLGRAAKSRFLRAAAQGRSKNSAASNTAGIGVNGAMRSSGLKQYWRQAALEEARGRRRKLPPRYDAARLESMLLHIWLASCAASTLLELPRHAPISFLVSRQGVAPLHEIQHRRRPSFPRGDTPGSS